MVFIFLWTTPVVQMNQVPAGNNMMFVGGLWNGPLFSNQFASLRAAQRSRVYWLCCPRIPTVFLRTVVPRCVYMYCIKLMKSHSLITVVASAQYEGDAPDPRGCVCADGLLNHNHQLCHLWSQRAPQRLQEAAAHRWHQRAFVLDSELPLWHGNVL